MNAVLNVGNERRQRSRHDVSLIQDIVGSKAIGIPALDRAAGAVILQHLTVAGVGDEHGCRAVHGLGLAAALRVVGIGCGVARADSRGQPVLGVVAEGEGAVKGEIAVAVAVAVIARRHRADRGVLIERVGGVADGRRRRRIVEPAIVSHDLTVALVGLVVGVSELDAARRWSRGCRRGCPGDASRTVEDIVGGSGGILDRRPGWRHGGGDRGAPVADTGEAVVQIITVVHRGRRRWWSFCWRGQCKSRSTSRL